MNDLPGVRHFFFWNKNRQGEKSWRVRHTQISLWCVCHPRIKSHFLLLFPGIIRNKVTAVIIIHEKWKKRSKPKCNHKKKLLFTTVPVYSRQVDKDIPLCEEEVSSSNFQFSWLNFLNNQSGEIARGRDLLPLKSRWSRVISIINASPPWSIGNMAQPDMKRTGATLPRSNFQKVARTAIKL